jgi:hypothetical protein
MSRRHVSGGRPTVRHPVLVQPSVDAPPPSSPQQLAFRLVIELYRATSGRAMEHKRLNRIAAAAGIMHPDERTAAVAHAVALGLLDLHDEHSICLTEAGRQLLR